MTIGFDHHILPSTDRERSAGFLTEVLGLPEPRSEGPFLAVDLANDVSLYVAGWDREVAPQHYAFLLARTTSTASWLGWRPRVRATGRTRRGPSRSRSTTTTGVAGATSVTRTGTGWRS